MWSSRLQNFTKQLADELVLYQKEYREAMEKRKKEIAEKKQR